MPGDPLPERRMRADAARNRERLLEVAKAAFTRHGADASLDDIAKQAGVGSGTLYRHFPTRDQLIEAVYHADAEKLAAAAHALCASDLPPTAALRQWLLVFVDYVAAKQIIMPVLDSVAGGSEKLYQGSSELIGGAAAALIRRAVEADELRLHVDPWDLLHPLIGVAVVPLGPGALERARRLVDVLIRGLCQDRPDTPS